jgi:hypothetical protein
MPIFAVNISFFALRQTFQRKSAGNKNFNAASGNDKLSKSPTFDQKNAQQPSRSTDAVIVNCVL